MEELNFDDKGLIPAIVQDDDTGEVLTLAYMNREALEKTISGEDVWFYSRSRQEMWHKGATSGNTQDMVDIHVDCDEDVLLVRVNAAGPACHTGATSCFFRTLDDLTDN